MIMEKGKLRFKNTKECNYRSSIFIDLTQDIQKRFSLNVLKDREMSIYLIKGDVRLKHLL